MPIPQQIVTTAFPVRLHSSAISQILLATRRIGGMACFLEEILSCHFIFRVFYVAVFAAMCALPLITALFYDLAQDKLVQIPKQGERRERELQELVKKGKRPVALFVDEAHDLNGHTLIGLKRLMEVVEDGGGCLSVILAGHPKLRNDLRPPTMEEIGYRTDIFTLDSIAGSQREYIHWLLGESVVTKTKPESILTTEAIDMLATRLRTPLQVQRHLTLALEAGFQTGEKPVTAELVETVLSRQLDDLEPTLMRHGYRLKDMVE